MKQQLPFIPAVRGANTMRRVRLLVVESQEWITMLLARFPNLRVVRTCMVGDTCTWMNYLATNPFDYAVYPKTPTMPSSSGPGIIHRIHQVMTLTQETTVAVLMGHISVDGLHEEMAQMERCTMQPVTDADEYADAYYVLRAKVKPPVVAV